ncbi:unnamed protein product, partial [Mesorhabditis belari]|uniref:DUF7741 domain-containing protein n=1 Tax=Mesorhabditis belari TaxID=2138241 RepID=A0AAF3J9C7_9BILA
MAGHELPLRSTRSLISMIRLFLFLSILPSITSTVVCYVCNGQSSTAGHFCSLSDLCVGPSCFFNVNDNGTWEAGCNPTIGEATSANLSCTYASPETQCECVGNFCNKLQTTLPFLKTFWATSAPGITISPVLPTDNAVPCFECGEIQINGSVMVLPCDRNHLCQGGYCMTVKGEYPYSLCATSWDGSSEVQCLKQSGQQERCVCAGQMCNFPYGPDQIPPTVPPTQGPNTDCPDGYQWNPNQQAVNMGNKLKDIIMNGFGGNSQALQNFQNGINTHICGYSKK